LADVFLSYAREDRAVAATIADALKQYGLTVFWDRKIRPGQVFEEVIERELTLANAVIVLWSSAALNSRWVRAEAEAAAEERRLISARLENVKLPFSLRTFQAVDLIGWRAELDNEDWLAIVAAVQTLQKDSDARARNNVVLSPIYERLHQSAPVARPKLLRKHWRHAGITVALATVGLAIATIAVLATLDRRHPSTTATLRTNERGRGAADGSSTTTPLNSKRQMLNPTDLQHYVWIPPGQFELGCIAEQLCEDEDRSIKGKGHLQGFWIGRTEVSVRAFKAVAERARIPIPAPPIVWGQYALNAEWRDPQQPIVGVSAHHAQRYCAFVGGRLPTEAEWEYAARAGRAAGDYGALLETAWYADNSGDTIFDASELSRSLEREVVPALRADARNATDFPRWIKKLISNRNRLRAVGTTKETNGWNVADMLGNAWEWAIEGTRPRAERNPLHARYVVRGGSWDDERRHIRWSRRHVVHHEDKHEDYGFRCVIQNRSE
jgi:formylglycine-generating enzyme required for sulfatase activity